MKNINSEIISTDSSNNTKKCFYVYKTTNLINGKIYIGKSKYRPGYKNYIGSGVALENAIKKYGKENFEKEILEEFYTEEEAFEAEKTYIKLYDSQNHNIGYNIAAGGGDYTSNDRLHEKNNKNYSYSKEEADKERVKLGSLEYKAKISETSKKYWASLSDEEREKQRQKIKDGWTSEARQARSDMLKARLADPVASVKYRSNLSKGVREANLRLEVQERRREAALIVASDPETKAKQVKLANQPWNIELNSKVRGPLSQITLSLNAGKITEEEANKRREELYKIQDEIHLRYWEQEIQYLIDHPSRNERARRRQLKRAEELKEKYSKENINE